MRDSLIHTIDSIGKLKPDSLMTDSLLHADSLKLADTLKTIVPPAPTGMQGIIAPSFPANENWVFVVLVVIFGFLAIGMVQSEGTFFQNFKSYFSKKETVDLLVKPTANIYQFQFLITLFTIAVFALMTYELRYQKSEGFNYIHIGRYIAIFSAYYLAKHLLFEIIGNTFFGIKLTRNYKNLYFSLMNVLALLIFPLLVLYTYQSTEWKEPIAVLSLIIVVLFYIVLIIKIFQIFYSKPLALFYIFLYLCTLEIIPVFALLQAIEDFT